MGAKVALSAANHQFQLSYLYSIDLVHTLSHTRAPLSLYIAFAHSFRSSYNIHFLTPFQSPFCDELQRLMTIMCTPQSVSPLLYPTQFCVSH